MSFDTFYAKIWKTGNSLVITIPSNLIKYTGHKEGSTLKIMIKKHEVEDDKV